MFEVLTMGRSKIELSQIARGEKGYTLIAVLILLLLGSLLIPPLLGYMATGLKTGSMYEKKTDELYAADAGIQAGVWRIKYDNWGPDYDAYDFDTAWPYRTETVNGVTADVAIQNVWIPTIPNPYASPSEARAAIESEKLSVVGTAGAIPGEPYRIMITYTPDTGDNLTVKSIGVWLPQDFTYVEDSCTLEDDPFDEYYRDFVEILPYHGGQAVVWSYDEHYPLFTVFPEYSSKNGTMSIEVTFSYTPLADYPNRMPAAIAWIVTGMDPGSPNPNDVPVSWDTDTRIFKITSKAGDTSIEASLSKCELRQMGDAMSGDYVAIGNSLLANDDPSWNDTYRETWYTPSTVELESIPDDADVVGAYLYWAGWFNEYSKQAKFSDNCSSFSPNWAPAPDSSWDDSQSYFRGRYDAGEDRELPLDSSVTIPLAQYKNTAAVVSVAWWQWETGNVESGDGLDFAISGDGGVTWSEYIPAFRGTKKGLPVYDYYDENRFEYDIPNECLTNDFKLKFKLVGFSESDDGYCCIDGFDIKVMLPDTDAIFKIGNADSEYSENLTAGRAYVMRNTMWEKPYGFSYACTRDVTALVKKYPVVAGEEHHTGNAIYTIDDVEADNGRYPSTSDDSHFAFAGWSLIIVYTSPKTAGHYLYLRDNNFAFHTGTGEDLDFDEDGLPGGDITNFVVPEPITDKYGNVIETVAAKLTCFVVEGDDSGTSSITITGQQSKRSKDLFNPESPAFDVWNGKSYPGTFKEDVDIDTFELLWADNVLTPGDRVLHLDLLSNNDAWNLVYLILSVRSETVTGGTDYYVIKGG